MTLEILELDKNILFYLDAGNPSTPFRLWNPKLHNVDKQNVFKLAFKQSELSWNWAPQRHGKERNQTRNKIFKISGKLDFRFFVWALTCFNVEILV